MKILLDNKYVMDLSVLNQIVEVERVGNYSSSTHKVLGEPTDVSIIRDKDLVQGEQAEEAEEVFASEELVIIKKELETAKLYKARYDAIERVLNLSPSIGRKAIAEWTESITSRYDLSYTDASTVRNWCKSNKEK